MKILSINYSIIKNGLNKKFSSVFLHNSNLTLAFLDALFREGLIRHYTIVSKKKIEVFFKYHKGISVINNITSMSTCSRSIHYKMEDICYWKSLRSSLNSLLIINTSKKVFSSNEIKNHKIGGQVLCIIN